MDWLTVTTTWLSNNLKSHHANCTFIFVVRVLTAFNHPFVRVYFFWIFFRRFWPANIIIKSNPGRLPNTNCILTVFFWRKSIFSRISHRIKFNIKMLYNYKTYREQVERPPLGILWHHLSRWQLQLCEWGALDKLGCSGTQKIWKGTF